MKTFCPECGPGVPVDEDGLCVQCGATAVGKAVDNLAIGGAEPEVEADAKKLCECPVATRDNCQWCDADTGECAA